MKFNKYILTYNIFSIIDHANSQSEIPNSNY